MRRLIEVLAFMLLALAAAAPFADRGFHHDALDEPGPVTDLQEVDLAARTAVGQPSLERDALPGVGRDVFDVRHTAVVVALTLR